MAILLILLFHFNLLRSVDIKSHADSFASNVFNAGWCGVDLFFALSGFLITRILYQAKESEGYFGNFYIRRVLRIFPLYYAVLFLTFVVIPHLPASLIPHEKLDRWARVETNPLWFWFYLSNFSTMLSGTWGHGILDVTWSLAIEEQFYLLWPWMVYKFDRDKLLRVCALVFVTAFIIRGVMTLAGFSPISVYVFTPARFDVIAVGAFVALSTAGGRAIPCLSVPRRIWILTAGALLGLSFWRGGFNNMDPVFQTAGLSLVAVNLGALMIIVLGVPPNHWITRGFSAKVLRSLGKYSYAIYLAHVPVGAFVRDVLYGPGQWSSIAGSKLPSQLLFLTVAAALAFVLAFVSWHLWEYPFLRLKKHVPMKSDKALA